MCLDELRSNIAIKQKKGLPFICASIIIWLLILIVILLDLPQNTENLLVLCCSCPLLPISWTIGKILKVATVYKGNIIKNLIMDCQSYTKYRPNETTGGIFVSWRRKEELPTGA